MVIKRCVMLGRYWAQVLQNSNKIPLKLFLTPLNPYPSPPRKLSLSNSPSSIHSKISCEPINKNGPQPQPPFSLDPSSLQVSKHPSLPQLNQPTSYNIKKKAKKKNHHSHQICTIKSPPSKIRPVLPPLPHICL